MRKSFNATVEPRCQQTCIALLLRITVIDEDVPVADLFVDEFAVECAPHASRPSSDEPKSELNKNYDSFEFV